MKRIGLLMVAVLLVVMLAACGSDSGGEKVYKIGISQIVEHPSLDATREGFLQALADAGIKGDNLKVDYNNGQGEPANYTTIAKKLKNAKLDLVLSIATGASQAVAQQVKKTPVVFAAVTDPLEAGIVDKLDKPSGNVTGASDTNPKATEQIMEFIAEHMPNVKTVGMVINEGEQNAVVMADNAEKTLSAHGIKLQKAPVTNTSEVKQAAESLIGKADVLFIALDNTVVSGVTSIIQVANDNKIPFFSSDRDTVEAGAFATVGFQYYDHGYQAGQMAVEILKNGKKPSDLAVTFPEKIGYIFNMKAAEAQGVTVTDAMIALVQDPDNDIIR